MSAQVGAGPRRTTLAQLLAGRGRLPPGLALELIDGLAVGLAAESCEVSRLVRLSPASVELELPGEGRAAGAVRFRPGLDAATTGPYMAWPELALALRGPGGGSQTGAGGEVAAVYCLGVLLYHMLSGRAPFAAPDLDVLATLHLKAEPPRPASQPVSPAIEELLWRALARRPEARFQGIAGFRQAVESVRQAPEAVAPPAGGTGPVPSPAAVALCSLETDRCIPLRGLDVAGPDGAREIQLGRGGPGADGAPQVDLGELPYGWRLAHRQAILRYEPGGWSVEAWTDTASRREGGAPPTRVNGVALAPGERRPVSVGDAIAFGPVRMLLVLYTAGPPSVAGPADAPAAPEAPGAPGTRGASGEGGEAPAAAPGARRAELCAASGTIFPIDRSPLVLGRLHAGSVPYPDVNLAGEPGGDTVSRQHARIYFQEDRWWIVQPQTSSTGRTSRAGCCTPASRRRCRTAPAWTWGRLPSPSVPGR